MGIGKIDFKNESHLWLLKIFCFYTTFSENLIFTKNLFIYLYIKHILHSGSIRLKLYHSNDIITIDTNLFIKEIEDTFSAPGITKEIYKNYYRRKR